MSNNLKVRLRSGDAEIEIEGSRGDIDQLLERWWQLKEVQSAQPSRPNGAAKPKRKPTQHATNEANAPDSSLDVNAIANQVKESEHFPSIEQKILHASGQRYNKVAFAIWFVNQPLTSGDIHRVLTALGVRIGLPSVSEVLKTNLKKLTTDKARKHGGAPAAYQLTAKARADFANWLLAAENEQ
ncbi:hypothetical protein [Bradyrhizobium liaoningense]|uniref:hypothetical protein n=1 Tax=Bradyrhizobium liaoningense TaxID=43992 RepID=UPI001BAC38B2|nr:hypothetical protein [Bradyrhizobium liaoningense]MBR0819227.1 hypothetical protein [Bradyrhizobium liaoningense]